jgi:hypothetical protein
LNFEKFYSSFYRDTVVSVADSVTSVYLTLVAEQQSIGRDLQVKNTVGSSEAPL